jgi:hypothetical protein
MFVFGPWVASFTFRRILQYVVYLVVYVPLIREGYIEQYLRIASAIYVTVFATYWTVPVQDEATGAIFLLEKWNPSTTLNVFTSHFLHFLFPFPYFPPQITLANIPGEGGGDVLNYCIKNRKIVKM